jgi:signal transduction histidine kinase
MPTGRIDPRWPKLLSLAAHDASTPLSVIFGYVRMLLTERVGPSSDAQRKMLLAIEESCAQLSRLVKQCRELVELEEGTAKFKGGTLDVAAVLAEAVAALPALPSREVAVHVTTRPAQPISGDAARLRGALISVLHAVRRELVTSDRLEVVVEPGDSQASVRITIGEPQRIEHLRAAAAADLRTFDEWRGGIGLTLANARRIIECHGGQIWSPAEDWKAAAVISLPVRGH